MRRRSTMRVNRYANLLAFKVAAGLVKEDEVNNRYAWSTMTPRSMTMNNITFYKSSSNIRSYRKTMKNENNQSNIYRHPS